MKLNDNGLIVLISALALLALGLITGSLIFYAVAAAILAFIAWDLYRLRRALASLGDRLFISSSLSRHEIQPGGSAVCTFNLRYSGIPGIRLALEPSVSQGSLKATPWHAEMSSDGEQIVSMNISPGEPGDYDVGRVKAIASSLFFREEAETGENDLLKVRIPIKSSPIQHNVGYKEYLRYAKTLYGVIEKRGGSDFSRVREYVAGDNVKDIDWALSSRAGKLIVKEYESERTLPLYLLVDISGQPQRNKHGVEAPLAIAASLVNRHLVMGEKVGVVCFSRSKVEYHLKQGIGREHFKSISDALSSLNMVDEGVAPGSATYASAMELYEVGQAFEAEAWKPILDETLRNYPANSIYDGFMQAINTAIGSSKEPCQIIVVTGLSMGLLSLMNGIRLARYHGHFVSVILFDSSGGLDAERKALLESALRRLRAQSLKASLLLSPDAPESVSYEGRIPIRLRWNSGR